MSNIEQIFESMKNNIRVHGAVLIVGAGASFESGLPLYAQFPSIIWQVIDEFPEIKEQMRLNPYFSSKQSIGNDIEKIKEAFNYIESNIGADQKFKELFSSINDFHKNKTSLVHKNICELLHEGYIKLIISFNWDDMFETEWERLYGTNINDQHINLIKPHGDVRNKSQKWIYPNNPGYISEKDLKSINSIVLNSTCTFIILGYSEQDEEIVSTLIKPNEKSHDFYRISPTAKGDNCLSYTASQVTSKLKSCFSTAQNNVWIRVDFSNQGGLENALLGRRLQPCDVTACPKLPIINDAKTHLKISNYVVIEGEPGSGKSITAYQLAYDYTQTGWEVLKFNNLNNIEPCGFELENNGYKTIYIVDDAQQLDKNLIASLKSKANSTAKIIITQTITNEAPDETVTISQKLSVETLHEYYKSKSDIILPFVQELNKKAGRSIGVGALDTSLDFVLNKAREEKNIWLYNYSLRGGWQSVINEYSVVQENDRADVLLSLISVKQILTLDKSVDKTWLKLVLQKYGYNELWFEEKLAYLHSKKLVFSLKEIRAPHIQTAVRIVLNYIKSIEKEEILLFQNILKDEMLLEENPLLGIAWFFNMVVFYDERYKLLNGFFSKYFWHKLLQRCINQNTSKTIAHACYVIESIIHQEKNIKIKDILNENTFFIEWFNNIDNETAYAFSRIMNSIINEDKELYKKFVNSLDISRIVENMKTIDTSSLYCWASFINRLLFNTKTKSAQKLRLAIPKEEIQDAIQNITIKQIGAASDLLCSLRLCDEAFCFDLYQNIFLPKLKSYFDVDFCYVLRELGTDFRMYILGEDLFDMGRPSKKEKDARIQFVNTVSTEMIRKAIFEGEPRDWDALARYFGEIYKYGKEKLVNAARDIDFSILDSKTDGLWNEQPDELSRLINMLYYCDKKATDNWVFSNREKIINIKTEIAQFSPRTTTVVIKSGGKLLLTESHRWSCNASAIAVLNKYDSDLCYMIVDEELANIKKSLFDLHKCCWDEYYLFFKELISIKTDLVDVLLSEDDIVLLEEKIIPEIKETNYNHEKKELRGLLKLTELIKSNTQNIKTTNSMERVENKINIALSN